MKEKNSFDHATVVRGVELIIPTQILFVVFQGAGADWRGGCTSRCHFFESDHRDSSARMQDIRVRVSYASVCRLRFYRSISLLFII